MSMFGEETPAIWEDGKDQESVATTIATVVIGQSCIIDTLNSHDYELGMRIRFTNIIIDTGGAPSQWANFTGWAYVIGITAFTVTVDYDITDNGSGTVEEGEIIKGYIALDRATLDETDYIGTVKVVNTSVINGDKHTTKKGAYSNFSIMLNLLRYVPTNRVNLARLLGNNDGNNFLFFPHVDKDFIKNSSNVGVLFNLGVKFRYVGSSDFRDKGFIRLESQKYTDAIKNIG